MPEPHARASCPSLVTTPEQNSDRSIGLINPTFAQPIAVLEATAFQIINVRVNGAIPSEFWAGSTCLNRYFDRRRQDCCFQHPAEDGSALTGAC